ncbi:hypothetical protein TSOC_009380 [Tetrabaena socialis]|uniref:Uncharacterized protein n=1 Tax=Tetrabaena socialis TaxID=47790 RepID=A0A2J7ZW25_9CHLO|nr:hypothetical protein TSOC_009380 [Tetrabaena socialis]|eukprot:PNH04465.1 hypothetical protein TSOC_009380 [Tetrabaena socialis]
MPAGPGQGGGVRLANATVLAIRGVVLLNWRAGSTIQAPGFDLVLPLLPGDLATVRVDGGYLLAPFCFPVALLRQAAAGTSRPPQLAGAQQYVFPVPLPGNCTDASTDPTRCYASAGLYRDMGFWGADVQQNGSPSTNNYLVHLRNQTLLCVSMFSDDCIARLGPLGCSLYTNSHQPPPLPPPPGAQDLGSLPAGSDGGAVARAARGSADVLGAVLGSVLGAGVAKLGVEAGAQRGNSGSAGACCGPRDGEW